MAGAMMRVTRVIERVFRFVLFRGAVMMLAVIARSQAAHDAEEREQQKQESDDSHHRRSSKRGAGRCLGISFGASGRFFSKWLIKQNGGTAIVSAIDQLPIGMSGRIRQLGDFGIEQAILR